MWAGDFYMRGFGLAALWIVFLHFTGAVSSGACPVMLFEFFCKVTRIIKTSHKTYIRHTLVGCDQKSGCLLQPEFIDIIRRRHF